MYCFAKNVSHITVLGHILGVIPVNDQTVQELQIKQTLKKQMKPERGPQQVVFASKGRLLAATGSSDIRIS